MTEPTRPFLLFHPGFVRKYDTEHWEYQMDRATFEKGWWKGKNCFAIDADCRRYKLLDVESDGVAWTIWNVFRSNYNRLLEVHFAFEFFYQLNFEQAREIFVDYVCDHRWWSASYETEKQFRERNANYTNMRELMEPVGLKGRWPK